LNRIPMGKKKAAAKTANFERLSEKWQKRAKVSEPLANHTTFKLGGPARMLIEIDNTEDLQQLVRELTLFRLPWRLMGCGSNLLIADEGLAEVVVVFKCPADAIRIEGEEVVVPAGVILSDLVEFAKENELSGIEFAAGIPGTVGGAIFGNAGAFGRSISETLSEASVLSRNASVYKAKCFELDFKYRRSCLYETKDIVLEARFRLEKSTKGEIEKKISEIMEIRREKHPNWCETPCAGSFFQNIDPPEGEDKRQAAGYLLEQAGAKDIKVGQARVYEKHANILTAPEGSSTTDVIELAQQLRKAVKEKFEIELMREVQIWPEDLGKDLPKYK